MKKLQDKEVLGSGRGQKLGSKLHMKPMGYALTPGSKYQN